MDLDYSKIESEELKVALREYLTLAAEMYKKAMRDAESAKAFLVDAKKALTRLDELAKKLGGTNGQQ